MTDHHLTRCKYCRKSIPMTNSRREFCDDKCRFAYWRDRNVLSLSVLIPCVREAYERLGPDRDLRKEINLVMAEKLGVPMPLFTKQWAKEIAQ